MKEKISIEDYLIKLSDEEAQKVRESNDASNYYFSDSGDIYRAPANGATSFWMSPDNSNYRLRYNWKTREIEVFTDSRTGRNSTLQFLESSPLPLYDFLNEETPEYWYGIYLEDLLKS